MADVKRKKGESFDSMLRRFNQQIQKSGLLIEAKRGRFRSDSVSEKQKRSSALRKISVRQRRAYLEKIGKLPPDEQKRRR